MSYSPIAWSVILPLIVVFAKRKHLYLLTEDSVTYAEITCNFAWNARVP